MDLGPEQELALVACGRRDLRAGAEGRVRELAARSDPERLAVVLDAQRLLALAGGRLLELAPDAFPDAFHRHVDEAAHLAAVRAVTVDSVARSLHEALEARGIASVPLKGTALARRLYLDLSRRSSADVDVLVGRPDLDAAIAAALELGYEPPADPLVVDGLPELHYTFVPAREWLPQVDLHWRIHWYETAFSRALLDTAVADGEGGLRPAPAYDLAALLLFFVRDGFIGLRYAADIATWWDVYAGELPAGGLAGVLADHPEVAPALHVGAVVCERLGGPEADAVLGAEPVLSRGEARALNVVNWTATSARRDQAADRAFVDWALRPPGTTAAFSRRHLRPPPEVIAKWYGLPEDARLRRRFWGLCHGPKYALRLTLTALSARLRRTQPLPR
jgi:hypothetical protein